MMGSVLVMGGGGIWLFVGGSGEISRGTIGIDAENVNGSGGS